VEHMAESLRADNSFVPDLVPEGPRWYACYTRARHEKRVDTMMRDRGVETFLPLVARESTWKDRKKLVEWPLFPSYIFGRFPLADAHLVLNIPGVSTLVKPSGRPVPIDDAELENVRLFAEALRQEDVPLEPKPFVAEGMWVEVVAGPFRGVRGVVVERRGRRRVLIGLKAIGQGLEVDLEMGVLRPIPAP
jgi:transcription antitermination factor NusG